MITLFRPEKMYLPSEIKPFMRQQIDSLTERISPIGTPLKVLRYEIPCEPIPILAWLHSQKAQQKIYWSDRNDEFEVACVGAADQVTGTEPMNYLQIFEYLEQRLSPDNPRLRYYGGLSFADFHPEVDWRALGNYRFIIPRFELHKAKNDFFFAFNIVANDIQEDKTKIILKELEELSFMANTDPLNNNLPTFKSRSDIPDSSAWKKLVKRTLHQLDQSQYQKIVLARKSVFDFCDPIDPFVLISKLKNKTTQCFHFLFQINDETAFLGASPERLYKREGRTVFSEAIAGTKPRGENPKDDAQFEHELLHSAKDTHEHKFVAVAIYEALNGLCSRLNYDKKFSSLKLEGGHHLVTRFNGNLNPHVYDENILSAMHPTPAVGGTPTDKALEAIQELEPFQRGWYAGPVGYVGYEKSEFAVAIRSALVYKKNLALFAGAGIVKGSTAEDEWNEIESKMKTFLRIFENKK